MITSHFIQANGLRLHYLRRPADGPTLLLLHGLTDGTIYWTPVIEALSDDFDIVAPDARPWAVRRACIRLLRPRSRRRRRGAGSVVRAAPAHRDGAFDGGMVATAFVAQHPALARAAIFEDPVWLAAAQIPSAEIRTQRANEWRRDLQSTQALTPAEQMGKCRAEHPLWSDEEVRLWMITKQQAHLNILEYIEHQPMNWRALVKAIRCPTLLITGDTARGVIISPQQAAEAQALNPRLTVVNISGAGHGIRRDDFIGYMAAVNAFLQPFASK